MICHDGFDNVEYVLNGRKLDYVVVHHMEPDHAATLQDLLYRYPETVILTNNKAKNMVRQYFSEKLADKIEVVDEIPRETSGKFRMIKNNVRV